MHFVGKMQNVKPLTNPLAIVDGKLIKPENYKEGEAICPGCSKKLIFRKCENSRDHYSHTSKGCSEKDYQIGLESFEHKYTKKWLCENKPDLHVKCRGGHWHLLKTTKGEWKQEVQWNSFRIDVVAGDVFIEVVKTHKCTPEKIEALNKAGIKWLEVHVGEPIEDFSISGHYWVSCKICRSKERKKLFLQEREKRLNVMKTYYENISYYKEFLESINKINVKWPMQWSKWGQVQSCLATAFKTGKNKGTRLIDFAGRDSKKRSFVVDEMGGGEKGLGKKEWLERLNMRTLPREQKIVIEYLKFEPAEFREIRNRFRLLLGN